MQHRPVIRIKPQGFSQRLFGAFIIVEHLEQAAQIGGDFELVVSMFGQINGRNTQCQLPLGHSLFVAVVAFEQQAQIQMAGEKVGFEQQSMAKIGFGIMVPVQFVMQHADGKQRQVGLSGFALQQKILKAPDRLLHLRHGDGTVGLFDQSDQSQRRFRLWQNAGSHWRYSVFGQQLQRIVILSGVFQLRIKSEGRLRIVERGFIMAQLGIDDGSGLIRLGKLPVYGNRMVQILQCGLILPPLGMHRTQHIERDNIAGIMLQNSLKTGHRLVLSPGCMVVQSLINDGTDRGVRRIGQTRYSGSRQA